MSNVRIIGVLLTVLAMAAGCPDGVAGDGGTVGDRDAGADDGGSTGDGDAGPALPDGGPVDPLCAEGATGPSETEHQVHHFVGTGGVEVWLTRDYEGQGAGLTSVWSTPRVSVTQGDVDVCVTDPARLAYDWTHHNWNDSAEVDVAANLRFVFEVAPGRGAVTFENLLTRVDDEGAVLAGPFSLEHQGGSPWP